MAHRRSAERAGREAKTHARRAKSSEHRSAKRGKKSDESSDLGSAFCARTRMHPASRLATRALHSSSTRSRSWSAGKKVSSVEETNTLIKRKRLRLGHSLADTFKYVESIIAAGFSPNSDTLTAVIGQDAVSLDQFVDMARRIRLGSTSLRASAWATLIANHANKRGVSSSEAMESMFSVYLKAAAEHEVTPSALVAAIAAFHQHEKKTAAQLFPLESKWTEPTKHKPPDQSEANIGRPGSSECEVETAAGCAPPNGIELEKWDWRWVLLNAHMHATLPRRRELFALISPLLGTTSRRLDPNKIIARLMTDMWSADGRDSAWEILRSAVQSGPARLAPDDLVHLWKVFCFTRYTNNYSPSPEILEDALRIFPPPLYVKVAASFLQAHSFGSTQLQSIRLRRDLDHEALDAHVANLTRVRAVCEALLDIPPAHDYAEVLLIRRCLIEALTAARLTYELPSAWDMFLGHTRRTHGLLLTDMLVACETRPVGSDIETALRLVVASFKLSPRLSQPPQAQLIACLAAGNALQGALDLLATGSVQLSGDDYPVVMKLMECGARVGRTTPTQTFLKHHALAAFLHPKCLLWAARLRQTQSQTPPLETDSTLWYVEHLDLVRSVLVAQL